MTAERWRQIEILFAQALDCPASERPLFLDQACAGDHELRRELESLLACDDPGQRLVEIPTVARAGAAANHLSGSEMAGRRIGPYRLIQLIGHGGMGAVYLGVRDDDQYQKQVAIKLLKRGMDTDFMLNRFRQERQILANLEHPFIARLLDGGATDDGLPYFVMEHVDGIPITRYAAEKNLSVLEKVRLFRLVCEAVQYAHQNLVVHRDIKPSNILTTKEGIPKLLDFGIAKVIDPGVRGSVTVTQIEHRMLTPDYASPEQVKGLPISTASDTYSLGAVLYELLTGKGPHQFRSDSFADMEIAIYETEPEKPSDAAARNENLSAAARKQLARQLAGDLDNIVLTALRKEPQRRYASAAEFSDDLRRHMEALPILAQEDRWTYRAGKFVRRNRLAVGAALLVAASLIGGIVTTAFQARRAERRFQIVRGLADTMLFELHDEMERLPGSTALRATTVRTVVKYLDALAQDGGHDPGLDLEIATAYERAGNLEGHPFGSNLGRGTDALSNYNKAIAIYDRLTNNPGLRGQATRGLIDLYLKTAQLEGLLGNPTASVLHFQTASSLARAASADRSLDIPPSTQANLYFRLADAEYERGSAEGELANYRTALEIAQRWAAADPGAQPAALLRDAHKNVANALARSGDLYGARESFQLSQEISEQLLRRPDATQEQQSYAIGGYLALADLLAAPDDPNFDEPAQALELYQTALEMAERLAASDPRNVNARRNVAVCLWRLAMILAENKPELAVEYGRKSQRISQELAAVDPLNAEYRYHGSRACIWLGGALHTLGRHDEAVREFKQAVELQNAIEAVSPERVWNLRVLSRAYRMMGGALLTGGHPEQALEALREGLVVADRMLQRAPTSLSHQLDRADVLEATGAYYLALASKGQNPARIAEWKAEARSSVEKSLAIWQDWNARNVAMPYAQRRLNRATALLASIKQP
jgi:tetratricopeptide (TPR) repeat protein/tRNA A-37 threonylcarbamoyl transferase component Bud32